MGPMELVGEAAEELVGHVVVRHGGKVLAISVVSAGWVDEPARGWIGDSIEHRRIRGVPAYRVWRAIDPG